MTWMRFPLGGTVVLGVLAASSGALAADCFVDSQNGDDSKNGSTEADAVKTQAKIPSSCTVVRYKRGSQFGEAVKIGGSAKTYTNYGNEGDPLPKFVVPHTTSSGSLVSAFQGGVAIDGLYLAGSKGDGTMSGLIDGVCVMLGANSQLLNCEITGCDIGIMLSGSGSLVQGNYIHDLTMAVDAAQDSGTYINAVGGAEGIFVNGSNNEIAYNSFVNCTDTAEWTGGSCDGGATEVTVSSGGTLTGVKIHHNFSYNNCGFFEVSGKGTFADSDFYANVSIDSGWLMLLQIQETTMSNIRWFNNTVVQHKGSTNAGMVTTIYSGSGLSGQNPTGGSSLPANSVSMTNNLVILDGVTAFGDVIDANITQTTNLVTTTDPGVVNVKGSTAEDFDLLESSTARDQGTTLASYTLDYLNRTVPDSSGKTDIGAFEYGSGGGGGTPAATGGAGPTATGGTPATGGTAPTATGGTAPTATGGTRPAMGGSSPAATGGVADATGGSAPATGGTQPTPTGGTQSTAVGTGGTDRPAATGGTESQDPSVPSEGGAPTTSSKGGSTTVLATGGASGRVSGLGLADTESGCGCSVPGSSSRSGAWLALFGLMGAVLSRRRRQ